jgi:hypothetical protein
MAELFDHAGGGGDAGGGVRHVAGDADMAGAEAFGRRGGGLPPASVCSRANTVGNRRARAISAISLLQKALIGSSRTTSSLMLDGPKNLWVVGGWSLDASVAEAMPWNDHSGIYCLDHLPHRSAGTSQCDSIHTPVVPIRFNRFVLARGRRDC